MGFYAILPSTVVFVDKKIACEKKMAGGRLFGFQKHSTVRPQGGQRLSFQGTVACSGRARGFDIWTRPEAIFLINALLYSKICQGAIFLYK